MDGIVNSFKEIEYVRYVDDFFVFSTNKEEAKEIDREVRRLLEEELLLNLNEEKSGIIKTNDLEWPEDEFLFESIYQEVQRILKTVYKLDKKNYKEYERNPRVFIESLHHCLNSIGIYIPRNWLQIKITEEINFIERLIKRFKSSKAFFKWTKKKSIYKYKVKWGKVPMDLETESIQSWNTQFCKKNKSFIRDVKNLSNELSEKFLFNLSIVINKKDSPGLEQKEALRIAKFCFNHLGRFKSNKIVDRFDDIIKNPWLITNLRSIRAYPQLLPNLIEILNEGAVNRYVFIKIIWLLGEFRNEDALEVIVKNYFSTLELSNKNDILLNTSCTEALLKIDTWDDFPFDSLYDVVDKWLSGNNIPNYRLVRNAFLILGIKEHDRFKETISRAMRNWEEEKRITLFLYWLDELENPNIIDNFDYVTDEIKKMYPLTEPEPNNYQS